MLKSFYRDLDPHSQKTSLYSLLPPAFFKQNSSHFHEINDKLVWDDNSPLHHVRFDTSLSLWERCVKMHQAIMGTHYVEKFYASYKEKQKATKTTSIFSDFCEEDWFFHFIPDKHSLKNAEHFLEFGIFMHYKFKEYKRGDKLVDNTIYIKIDENKKIFYTLKNLNGELIETEILETISPTKRFKEAKELVEQEKLKLHIGLTIQRNGHFQNKRIIQFYNYDKTSKTIECRFLSSQNKIITHKIDVQKLNNIIDGDTSVFSSQKMGHQLILYVQLSFLERDQNTYRSGVGALSSSLANVMSGRPSIHPIEDSAFKKSILGYLAQSEAIQQLEHYVIDEEYVKGQKGLLDSAYFPLLARKIYYNALYYHNKKIDSTFDYPIKFILYAPPFMHILILTYLLLETLRHLIGIIFTLICSVTIVPLLHLHCQFIQSNKEKSESTSANEQMPYEKTSETNTFSEDHLSVSDDPENPEDKEDSHSVCSL